MIQLAALLARPLLGKLPVSKEAKDKLANVNTLLTGGSGETWIPLGRQQATLPIKHQLRSKSASAKRGEGDQEGKPIPWVHFDWPALEIDDCAFRSISWRFYRNGLISLELVASKDGAGLDTRDLVGHSIELRDRDGFLVGIWSAAFAIHRDTELAVFHAAATDDFLPLKLHFDEVRDVQEGVSFRI